MSPSFDWNDLRYFLEVARTGAASTAAKRMGVNHATVLRRLEALERRLGAALFERHARGHLLTPRGERLLASAEAMEAEATKVEKDIGSARNQVSGLVRINTLEGFGNFFLASRLPAFAQAYPSLQLELTIIQQIVALSRREADIAITLTPPQGDGFRCEPLTDYRLFVYGARSYLTEHPPIQTREDLRAHRFCGYIEGLVFVRGLDYLHEVSPEIEAQLQSSSLQAQMQVAASGYGLCVLPAFVAAHDPGLVRVLPDETGLQRTYWLVSSATSSARARIDAARRFIRDAVRRDAAIFDGNR